MQKVKTEYAIEISINDMLNILSDEDGNLCTSLRSIPGVERVLYDADFGPVIYVTLQNEQDSQGTYDKIMNMISRHANNDFVIGNAEDALIAALDAEDEFSQEVRRTLESSRPPPYGNFITHLDDGSVYRVVVERLH